VVADKVGLLTAAFLLYTPFEVLAPRDWWRERRCVKRRSSWVTWRQCVKQRWNWVAWRRLAWQRDRAQFGRVSRG
jgi:hypothetical protein